MNKQQLYSTVNNMRRRCFDPRTKQYKNYGGRGITVCDRWMGVDGTRNFFKDMNPTYRQGLTIERVNVNGNYEPANCAWVTWKEQENNRTNNVRLTYNGQTKTMTAWANELGLKKTTVWQRINAYHWTVDRALSTPVRQGA